MAATDGKEERRERRGVVPGVVGSLLRCKERWHKMAQLNYLAYEIPAGSILESI